MKIGWTGWLRVAMALVVAGGVMLTSGCNHNDLHFPSSQTPKFFVAMDNVSNADNVNVFSVDAATGQLSAVAGSPFTTGLTNPVTAVVDPAQGSWIFAADRTGKVQSLTLDSTGTPTVVSTVDTGYGKYDWVNGMAVTADGKYLYTATDTTDIVEWSINQSTGALTEIGTYTTPDIGCTTAVAVSGSFLYTTGWCAGDVYIDAATIASNGTLSGLQQVTVPAATNYISTVAVDKTGKFLYAGDGGGTLTEYTIASNGTLTYQAQTLWNSGTGDMNSLSFSSDNKFLYAANDHRGPAVFAVDQNTGALSEIAGSPFGTEDSFGMVLVDPSSSFVYDSNAGADIVAYQRDQTTGALSPLSGATPTTYTTKYTSAFGFAITH